jgi:8-oxo-dGTP pyrophosphatase MutT (NUDIX family)
MSITTEEIQTAVDRYLAKHPEEASHLQPLSDALAAGKDLTSRTEFDGGHVTCGAAVIDDDNRLLLVQHIGLGRWLLPGGHLEPQDSGLYHAALRELEEETGISSHDTIGPADLAPVDIDVHVIPANPGKGEPEHWHADFRWVYRVQEPKVILQAEEVGGYAWQPINDAPGPKLAAKLTDLLN